MFFYGVLFGINMGILLAIAYIGYIKKKREENKNAPVE
jgi:hypothetical protein